MSILRRSAGPLENPNIPITAGELASMLGMTTRTAAGVAVTQESATRQITVMACQRLIAETLGTLPIGVFIKDGKAPKRIDAPTWLEQPNSDIDQVDLVEDFVYSLLSDGNGYTQIIRDKRSAVVELYPQDPGNVDPRRDGNPKRLHYVMNAADGGTQSDWAPPDVLHMRAFRRPGSIRGMSPIERARQGIGVALAAEEFGAAFFGNGATANGVIEHPNEMTREQARVLVDTFVREHQGASQAHKPGVLTNGATWKQTTIPPDHAQFLETQKFSVEQIARLYRVPPHLVGDVERSTSWGTGIEEQGIGFVVYTLRPWIVRIERGLTRLVRNLGATDGPYVRMNVEGLLRGSVKDRFDAYAVGRQWGWLSVNDILALEDESPVEGGDTYLTPLNMIDAADNASRPLKDRAQAAYFLSQAGVPAAQILKVVGLGVGDIGPLLEAGEPPDLIKLLFADALLEPDMEDVNA